MIEGKEEVKQEDFDKFVEKILNYKPEKEEKQSEESIDKKGKTVKAPAENEIE